MENGPHSIVSETATAHWRESPPGNHRPSEYVAIVKDETWGIPQPHGCSVAGCREWPAAYAIRAGNRAEAITMARSGAFSHPVAGVTECQLQDERPGGAGPDMAERMKPPSTSEISLLLNTLAENGVDTITGLEIRMSGENYSIWISAPDERGRRHGPDIASLISFIHTDEPTREQHLRKTAERCAHAIKLQRPK